MVLRRVACRNVTTAVLPLLDAADSMHDDLAKLPHYRLIAFDFDGTLADSFPLFLSSFGEIARRHRFREFTPEELQGMRRLSSREFMARAAMPAWKLPAVVSDFRRLMGAQAAQVKLFDGIADALRVLAASGATLAVVTSNSESTVRAILGPELSALFQHVDCGISLFGKQARLQRLMRRGQPAMRMIYIGDELRDAEAARDAGCAFGGVAWGYTCADALRAAAPERMFMQPSDLAALAGTQGAAWAPTATLP